MKWTDYYIPTLKEVPADAEVISHILMLRAGMIRKTAAGIFTYLPLGLRTIRKFEDIVREEMNGAGAMEVFLPAVQPSELWLESGRWTQYGKELLRMKDRHERDFCFGPTHEEIITDLVRHELTSYKNFPKNFYQIQTKFRDEIRPRFGLMRCREFGMKDAYSFDISEEGLDLSYRKMRDAYSRIFSRCGLKFQVVEADSGTIGGKECHEYMVLASSGEDAVISCPACGYAANMEKAEVAPPEESPARTEPPAKEIEKVSTPDMKSIEQVTAFLSMPSTKLVKTLLLLADGKPVAVLVRGDHELSEAKLKSVLQADVLEMADEQLIAKLTGGPMGFSGPVGLKGIRKIADFAVKTIEDFVTGANEKDMHYLHVHTPRDFEIDELADVRRAVPGDRCPKCKEAMQVFRGIEVGHIFKLGTKYSKAMKAFFTDEKGQEHPIIMGCYGIGIGRTVAAAIEQNHDENGIIWPQSLSPFEVLLCAVNTEDPGILKTAAELYRELRSAGIDVLFDDRIERPGIKFKDADLIGITYRLTIGARSMKENSVEIYERRTRKTEKIPRPDVAGRMKEILKKSP
jgi:prolyl-tRNA synthetase